MIRCNQTDLEYTYTREQKELVKQLYDFARIPQNNIIHYDFNCIVHLKEQTDWSIIYLSYDEKTRAVLNRIRTQYTEYYNPEESRELSVKRKNDVTTKKITEWNGTYENGEGLTFKPTSLAQNYRSFQPHPFKYK